jgi:tetratricopeptide (TPR) repeat protein
MTPATLPLPNEWRHIELGKTLVKKGLFFEAFDHFKSGIQTNPDCGIEILIFLYKSSDTCEWVAMRHLTIAKIYVVLELWSEAYDVLVDNLDTDVMHEPTYDFLAKLASKTPLASKIKGLFEDAVAQNIYFSSIITVLPKLYLEDKNYQKAIDLYRQLIQVFPDEYRYYTILSELYFRKRDYEAASQVLTQLIELAPFKSDELVTPISQILTKIPRNSQVRRLLATLYFRAFKPIEGCQQLAILVTYHANQTSGVIDLLNAQLEAFPDHPEILYLISELMVGAGDYIDALAFIERLIPAVATHCDKALVLVQKISESYPDHAVVCQLLGHGYYQQGNMLQALQYYDQCLSGDVANPIGFRDNIQLLMDQTTDPLVQGKARLIMAKIISHAGDHDMALVMLDALKSTPLETEGELLRIGILNQMNAFEASQQHLQTLRSTQRFHPKVEALQITTFHQWLAHHLAVEEATPVTDDHQLQRASFLLAKDQTECAIQELQKMSAASPLYGHAQQMTARAFFESSRYDLAIQLNDRLIKHHTSPDILKSAHYWRGLAHVMMSDSEAALQSFETVLTYDQAYLNAARMVDKLRQDTFLNHHGLVILGCHWQAPHSLVLRKSHVSTKKTSRHPFEVIGFAQSHNDDGCRQCIKRQYQAARESFNLALQMDPSFHVAHINLAFLSLLEGDVHRANEHRDMAEQLAPHCPYSWFISCLCAWQDQRIDHAIQCIKESMKQLSKDGLFYIVLGDLFYQQSQLELAVTYWQKASEFMDVVHMEQRRNRPKHMSKIGFDYWVSPELLSLR